MQNIIITFCEQYENALAKVCEKTCACPSIIEQNTTNEFDKTIIIALCQTLFLIALIAALTIIITFVVKHIANNCKEKKERKYKQKQRDFELKKEYQAKVLDYLKGEIDSYAKIPKLITDIDKTSKLIDKLEDDDSNLKEIKELWGQICEKTDADKKLWQTVVEKSKEGSIKIDKNSIINMENNLYLSNLKNYISELSENCSDKNKSISKT